MKKTNRSEEIYRAVENMVLNIYFELHTVYEPGENSFYPDWHCAAVDLFEPGMTFKLYFTLDENNQVQIKEVERWYFG